MKCGVTRVGVGVLSASLLAAVSSSFSTLPAYTGRHTSMHWTEKIMNKHSRSTQKKPLTMSKDDHVEKHSTAEDSSKNSALSRRLFLVGSFAAMTTTTTTASAYEKSFPVELQAVDAGDLDSRQRKVQKIRQDEASAAATRPGQKPLTAALWGSALWLLSGSRSNPLITPVSNILYDAEQEEWLRDRNDGLFANPPATVFVILAVVFFAMGSLTDMAVIGLADGNQNLSIQLAGVSLIGGASLELGRIASGEKAATRDEFDRSVELEQEFEQFAQDRLRPGGNCHRNEVVQAFRRYFAKYRQADSEEFPLTDLEIERLLRVWSRTRAGVDMTSAGFYNGIQINKEADVFVQR